MWRSVGAELLVTRRRTSTWVMLAVWTALSTLFGYLFPYMSYVTGSRTVPGGLGGMLPSAIVSKITAGLPFYGGAMVLIAGVLAFGSDYGWGTLKTLFLQRSGRLNVLVAKTVVLGIIVAAFVLSAFGSGAVASVVIAVRERAAITWPSPWLLVRALVSSWFLLAVWAALGALLAVASRGTGLAIGLGILWGLVVEGLVTALASQSALFKPVADLLLRANGYSLLRGLGATGQGAAANGPGAFSGPFVSEVQALVVLAAYLAAFVMLTAWVLQRRDVA